MVFSDFIEAFERRLATVVEERVAGYRQLTTDQGLLEAIEHVTELVKGGKRVRPYLCAVGLHKDVADISEDEWTVCVALELFHVFCLIHDDVIDDAALRRGVPTIQSLTEKAYPEVAQERAKKIGESQAILVGDLVFSWVTDLIGAVSRRHEDGEMFAQEFQAMVNEVVIGQMIDVDFMGRREVDRHLIEEKMYLKTASYTFIRPMRIGLAMVGASEDHKQFATDFGRALGLAFQMQDDLFDLTGEESGEKTRFLDVKDDQHTYFSFLLRTHKDPAVSDAYLGYVGRDLRDEEKSTLRILLQDSGVLEQGQQLVDEYFDQARTILGAAPAGIDIDACRHLLKKIQERSS